MRLHPIGLVPLLLLAALGCRQTSDSEREPALKPVSPPTQTLPQDQPGRDQPGTTGPEVPAAKDIVAVAREAGTFNTLLAAIDAAELRSTLAGPGPFTVFAPTDEAFAKLPKEQLDALLADKEALRKVLTYHVIPKQLSAAEIQAGKMASLDTVAGVPLKLDTTRGVKVGNASVIKADIQASNGVIHVIDTVLMPSGAGGAAVTP